MKGVMKYQDGPGHVELREIPEPTPGPGQIKIRVEYAGICGSDLHIYDSNIAITTRPPVVIGHEFSGVVAEVGEGVTDFKPGDRIVAEAVYHYCGKCKYCRDGFYNLCVDKLSFGYVYNGAFERYTIVEQKNAHHLPDEIDLLSAAMLEPLACVCHGVYDQCHLEAGNVVLVSGPGAIGLMAAQVAKAEGCEVILTGTDVDEERLDVARKLGIHHVVNIQKDDLKKLVSDLTDGYGVDVVLECSGSEPGVRSGMELVRKRGWFCQIGLTGKPITFDIETICYKELHFSGSMASRFVNWEKGMALLRLGLVDLKPLATDIFPLEDWEKAFQMFREKKGLKLIFQPKDE